MPSGPAQAAADLVRGPDQRRVARRPADLPGRPGREQDAAPRFARESERPSGKHLEVARRCLGRPPLGLGLDVAALRVVVEHDRHQLNSGGSVDRRVMDDRQHREALVGQPLDDVRQPKRLAPVQRPGDEAADERRELLVAARAAGSPNGGRGSRCRSRGPRSSTDGPSPAGPPPAAGAAAREGAAAARAARATPRRAGTQGCREGRRSTGPRRDRTARTSRDGGTWSPARKVASSPLSLVGWRRTKCASLRQRPPGLGRRHGVVSGESRTTNRSSVPAAEPSPRDGA